MEGSLTRWRDPIPKDAPSPYEVKKVEQTVHSRARAALFGEDTDDMVDDAAGDNDKEPDVVLDDDMDMDDDFVVDDLGGGMLDDEPELDKWTGGGVREMGKASILGSYHSLLSQLIFFSVSVTKAQPPFQSGSTPMDGKRRYLGAQATCQSGGLDLFGLNYSLQHDRRDRSH